MGRLSIRIISGVLTMGISTYYYRPIENPIDLVGYGTDKYPIAVRDDGSTMGCTPGTSQHEEYIKWVNAGNGVGIALTSPL